MFSIIFKFKQAHYKHNLYRSWKTRRWDEYLLIMQIWGRYRVYVGGGGVLSLPNDSSVFV